MRSYARPSVGALTLGTLRNLREVSDPREDVQRFLKATKDDPGECMVFITPDSIGFLRGDEDDKQDVELSRTKA